MDAPTVNQPSLAQDDTYTRYKSWNEDQKKIFSELLPKRYAELKPCTRESKKNARIEIAEVINTLTPEELSRQVKDIDNVGAWLREVIAKTTTVAEKNIVPSSETINAAEKAVVKQKRGQGRGAASKNANQKWRPKKTQPEKSNQTEAVQTKQASKKIDPEFTPLKSMPIEKFDIDPLQANFKEITDKALQVNQNVTGSEKNEFATVLKRCKEMLDSLKSSILLAQKGKETLLLLSGIVDRKNTHPNEFAHDIYPLRDLEKQLDDFVNKNQDSWNKMLSTLRATRENSKPLKISEDALAKGEILCKATSSETEKDIQPRREINKKQQDRIKTRDANYRLSYYCLKQMEVHISKLKHRIGEIKTLYSNYPTLAKYKEAAEIFDSHGKHVLNNDNKGAVIDESLAELYKIVAAKEIIDLVLEGNDLMEVQFKKDYMVNPYLSYKTLFDDTLVNLKEDVEKCHKKIYKTLAELDKIIKDNDIKDYSESDRKHLKQIHTTEDYNKLLEDVQLRHQCMYAAITQKLKLEAILRKMDERMNKKASAYLPVKISQGFNPLHDQFNDMVKSLENQ